MRATYYTYITIWHSGYELNYGPFRDSIDPGGNASLGKLVAIPVDAPYGWYEVTVSVQYPDGTELDSAVEADAFQVKAPPVQYIWGYVTDTFGAGQSGIAVTCDLTGATVFTVGGGYYNLDPWASLMNSPITATDPLGRYAPQTKYVDYDGYTPVRLDFVLGALYKEVGVSDFYVNGI